MATSLQVVIMERWTPRRDGSISECVYFTKCHKTLRYNVHTTGA